MQFEDIMKLVLGKPKQEGGEKEDNSVQPEASPAKTPLKKGSWRHHLSDDLHSELNHLVYATHKHRHAYKKTLKIRDAQLWVALAQMSRRLGQLEAQLGVEGEVPNKETSRLQDLETSGSPEVSSDSSINPGSPEIVESQSPEPEQPEKEQPNQQMLISGQPASEVQPQAQPEQSEQVQEF